MWDQNSFLNRFLRGILYVLLAFCVYLIIFGIWSVYVTSPEHDVEKSIAYVENETTESVVEETISDEPGRSMYLQLNDVEQQIYRFVRDSVENSRTSLKMEFPGYTIEEVEAHAERAFSAVYCDYPEYMWWSGERTSRCVNDVFSKKTVNAQYNLIYHDYWENVTEKDKYSAELSIKAKMIASQAKKLETTYEQVKYVHDYLVKKVTRISSKEANEATMIAFQSHSAYGALINHLATSEGYSKAFQLIMSMMDVECTYVEGKLGVYDHAWNCVRLDDEYYWVDVTKDDYDWEDYPNAIAYDYFCFTSDELLKSYYELPEIFDFPECTATEYNYFYKEGFYLDKFDYNAVCQILEREKGKELISFKFSEEEEAVRFASVLIHDEGRIHEIPYYKDQHCGFTANGYLPIFSITVYQETEDNQ